MCELRDILKEVKAIIGVKSSTLAEMLLEDPKGVYLYLLGRSITRIGNASDLDDAAVADDTKEAKQMIANDSVDGYLITADLIKKQMEALSLIGSECGVYPEEEAKKILLKIRLWAVDEQIVCKGIALPRFPSEDDSVKTELVNWLTWVCGVYQVVKDFEADFKPAAWYKVYTNVKPERLRKAVSSNDRGLKIRTIKKGRKWHYNLMDVTARWPDDVPDDTSIPIKKQK